MTPSRTYKGDKQAGALDVHPDFRSRSQHLDVIRIKKRAQGEAAAVSYWLTHCPRISKRAFLNA